MHRSDTHAGALDDTNTNARGNTDTDANSGDYAYTNSWGNSDA
jgi:hypothetical protein